MASGPKPAFRPWNSFLAKKSAADAATRAAAHAARGTTPAVSLLTAGLIDTYEGINRNYYHQQQPSLKRGEGGGRHDGDGDGDGGRDKESERERLRERERVKDREVPAAEMAKGSGEKAVENAGVGAAVRRVKMLEGQVGGGEGGNDGGPAQAEADAGEEEEKFTGGQYCDKNYDYIVRPGDMFHNRYMLEKVIGRGSFGQVVRAYDTRTNSHVAVKIIKNNELYVEQASSEVRMTAYLNRIDPDDEYAIMRIFDKFIFRGHQCLVLELLSFSLYDLLRSTEFFGVSLNLVRKFCIQILSCLAFLSRPDVNIAHCDLKPENVLLRHSQCSAIKVVDFGASCRVNDSMFTYVQSRFYRAPEVILGLPYDCQVDVWSLGCMLVELHTGYPLFAGRDEADQMAVIVERLGLPPKHMLDAGKKTELFFEKVPVSANGGSGVGGDKSGDGSGWEWALRSDIGKNPGGIIPGSKPIQDFVDELTSSESTGKRKRVTGGHSENDYHVFLELAMDMMLFSPDERISSSAALNNAFVSGASLATTSLVPAGDHEESPVRFPADPSAPRGSVDPGRAAPLRQMSANGVVTVPALRPGEGEDEGALGKVRHGKAESEIVPVPAFIFHSSDWAEECGIDPPSWRVEGPAALLAAHLRGMDAGEADESLVCTDLRPVLPSAGGGAPLRPPTRPVKKRPATCFPTVLGQVVGPRTMTRVVRDSGDLDGSTAPPAAPSSHCGALRRVQCL